MIVPSAEFGIRYYDLLTKILLDGIPDCCGEAHRLIPRGGCSIREHPKLVAFTDRKPDGERDGTIRIHGLL
jgi:hypothetical protein